MWKANMKPKKKWSETKTLDFVRSYRANPCLWDVNHKDYKSRKVRESVCCNIAETFNCSPNDVRRKIKSLRSVYNQERNKIEESICYNVNDIYVPSIIWYDEMDAIMNFGEEDPDNEYIDDVEDGQREAKDYELDEKLDNCSSNNENSEDENAVEVSLPRRLRKIRPLASKTLKNYSKNLDAGHKINNTSFTSSCEIVNDSTSKLYSAIDKLHDLSNRKMAQEDEFDIFGRSVAQQLRNFNDIKASLRVQHRIQGILSEERIVDAIKLPLDCCTSSNNVLQQSNALKRKELSDVELELAEVKSKKLIICVSSTDKNQT